MTVHKWLQKTHRTTPGKENNAFHLFRLIKCYDYQMGFQAEVLWYTGGYSYVDLATAVAAARPGVYLAKARLYQFANDTEDEEYDEGFATEARLTYLRWCGTRKAILASAEGRFQAGQLSDRKYAALTEMLRPPLDDDSEYERD